MSRLEDYADKYSFAAVHREDGILQVRLHENGEPFLWTRVAHRELSLLFADIAADLETLVVILTGTGTEFCTELGPGPKGAAPAPENPARPGYTGGGVTADHWNITYTEGKRLLTSLMEIDVPVIAAINGPVHIHGEILVMSDVVLAAPHVTFQDRHMDGSLRSGAMVAGDGGHVIWPLVLGENRGRYFLLTSQVLTAQQAMDFGAVNEIVPADQLLNRAWELARSFTVMSPLVTRYFRTVTAQKIKRELTYDLGYGLALEGLAVTAGRGPWDPTTPVTSARE